MNNGIYWYRLPNNLIRIDVEPESIILHTSYTHQRGGESYPISWRQEAYLAEAVNNLTKALSAAIFDKSEKTLI